MVSNGLHTQNMHTHTGTQTRAHMQTNTHTYRHTHTRVRAHIDMATRGLCCSAVQVMDCSVVWQPLLAVWLRSAAAALWTSASKGRPSADGENRPGSGARWDKCGPILCGRMAAVYLVLT